MPTVMTDNALKGLLRSACNSPEARRMLRNSDKEIGLHQAIAESIASKKQELFVQVMQLCHENNDKGKPRKFLSPTKLEEYLESSGSSDDDRELVIFLGLAFAMIDEENRIELIYQLLRKFPDAADDMGVSIAGFAADRCTSSIRQKLQDEPVVSGSDLSIPSVDVEVARPGKQVSCFLHRIDELDKKKTNVEKLVSSFADSAERLTKVAEVSQFAEQGEVDALLHLLESGKISIDAEAQQLLELLSGDCESDGENTCDLKKIVDQVKRDSLTGFAGLVAKANEMRPAANELLAQEKRAKAELLLLSESEVELNNQLQRPSGQAVPEGKDALSCKVIATLAAKRQIVETLAHDLSVEIGRRQTELVGRIDQLGVNSHPMSGKSNLNVEGSLVDLRKRVLTASSLSELVECHEILLKIEECNAERDGDDRTLMARQFLEGPESLDNFLSLCEGLIAQGDRAVALLLLLLRQLLHPVEEISANVDRAIGVILEVACNAGMDDLPSREVWSALFEDRWLQAIDRDDLESVEILECLVVMNLGAAVLIDGDKGANGLVNLGVDLSVKNFPELLIDVVNAVVARSPYRIIPSEASQARLRQEREIREKIAFENGKYRHIQCGNTEHFARFEAIRVFPALEALWEQVSSDLGRRDYLSAHDRVVDVDAEQWYEQLERKYDKGIRSHPHYSAKIRKFISGFRDLLDEHVAYCEKFWTPGSLILDIDAFIEAVRQWAGNKRNRIQLANIIESELSIENSGDNKPSIFERLAHCRTVISRCPSFVRWYRKQRFLSPEIDLEHLVLQDIVRNIPFEVAERELEEDGAWDQLGILWKARDVNRADYYLDKGRADARELENARKTTLDANSLDLVAIFDTCSMSGRIRAAKSVLEECRLIANEKVLKEEVALREFVDRALKSLKSAKDFALRENMPESWGDQVFAYSGKIELQLERLRSADPSSEASSRKKSLLGDAVAALEFLVSERSQVFDAVDYHLESYSSESFAVAVPEVSENQAAERCPEVIKYWKHLASQSVELSDDVELKRNWLQFVKAFGKACNLYHDESHERKPFATVPSIQYPFTVFQTSFYKPQSEFLKRPLRLYLFRQSVDKQALQRLEFEVAGEESAAWLHIVFAVNDVERIRKHFKFDKGFKNFLIADDPFIYGVCMAEKHDVPVRQALHASVTDLVSSSPFVAQGYCHQSNNIYVGRKEILQRLLNTPQAMIWGGRRIGKTSVLHALETVISKKPGYSVALVYVDIEEGADPDLAIAQQIASSLDLNAVSSITDLERQISRARRKGQRFAFLIDEVDEYIKKSRLVHGDKFPLATALRQLVMDDSSKDTILVYSGYHQLYFEAKLDKSKRRVGHPFVNVTQELPIRDLNHDDVHELVKTGFEEMLGIAVHPDVPALISKRASRHPAFVQEFCRCLLEYVSKRRSPGVQVSLTTEDVEEVYSADGRSIGGEQPFIFYVEETLGYNLSDLGRAIMLTIEDEQFHSVGSIHEQLCIYSDLVGIDRPKEEHFYQTIELLVMTNLLTQDPECNDCYRVTYPTFIDILRRLDKLGKAAIEKSLKKYDLRERLAGVLR